MPIFLKGEPGFIGPQGEPGLPGLPGTKVSGVFIPSFLSEFFCHVFSPLYSKKCGETLLFR